MEDSFTKYVIYLFYYLKKTYYLNNQIMIKPHLFIVSYIYFVCMSMINTMINNNVFFYRKCKKLKKALYSCKRNTFLHYILY